MTICDRCRKSEGVDAYWIHLGTNRKAVDLCGDCYRSLDKAVVDAMTKFLKSGAKHGQEKA